MGLSENRENKTVKNSERERVMGEERGFGPKTKKYQSNFTLVTFATNQWMKMEINGDQVYEKCIPLTVQNGKECSKDEFGPVSVKYII